MTAEEKQSLAAFLDLAAAATGGGYRTAQNGAQEPEYHFDDDPVETSNEAPMAEYAGKNQSAVKTADTADSLEQIAADVRSCAGCKLCAGRTNAVPGEGVLKPQVLVIGEGPGADEDASGRPFVGRAGQLLDKMLAAINLSRDTNCFIANVIKCRPPANRDPQPDETAACAGFLKRQLQLLNPRFILCAGRIAAQTLLDTTEPIGRLRGRFIDFDADGKTIPFLATYHPSALLRNEDLKRPAWEDLKLLRAALGETAP